jgi:hypothetical protein
MITNGDGNTLWLVFCSSLLAGWMKCALWIFDGGQVAIMCDESLNGTHFATMQFIYNVANAAPYMIGVFLVGFFDFYYWAAICIVYNFVFLLFSKKTFVQIDLAEKTDFIWDAADGKVPDGKKEDDFDEQDDYNELGNANDINRAKKISLGEYQNGGLELNGVPQQIPMKRAFSPKNRNKKSQDGYDYTGDHIYRIENFEFGCDNEIPRSDDNASPERNLSNISEVSDDKIEQSPHRDAKDLSSNLPGDGFNLEVPDEGIIQQRRKTTSNIPGLPELFDRRNGSIRSRSDGRGSPEFISKAKGWKKLKPQLPKLKSVRQDNSGQFGRMGSGSNDFDLITPPKFQQNSSFAEKNTGE